MGCLVGLGFGLYIGCEEGDCFGGPEGYLLGCVEGCKEGYTDGNMPG